MSRNGRLYELQAINDIFIKISNMEDAERICGLAGKTVYDFNKDCQVLVSLYDCEINAIRIRTVIGPGASTGKALDISELVFTEDFAVNDSAGSPLIGRPLTEKPTGKPADFLFSDISFRPEALGENEFLLKSGRLEPFSAGLYELLGKNLLSGTCEIIEKTLDTGSIRVVGFSDEEKVFGGIFILCPAGNKIKNISAIETIAGYVSRRIAELYSKKALLESENTFKSLFEQASLCYQSLDEKGLYIDVNKVWLETLGYSYKEVLGKSFGDFLAPESVELFKKYFPYFREAGTIHGAEFEALRKDGERVHILLDGRIGYNPDGSFKQTYCVFKDITAQRKAERKALESEKLLRSMIDAITESAYLMDSDGRIISINEAAARRLNSTIEEIMGCSIYNFLPEEVVSNRKKKVGLVLSTGKPLTYEDMQRGRDYQHSLYPVYDYYNRVSRIAVFSTDITEYKVSENKLKWELALNRALAQLSDALIDSDKSIEMISELVLSTSKQLTGSAQGYVSSIDPETGDNVIHTLDKMLKDCNVSKQCRKFVFPKGSEGFYPGLLGHSLNLRKGFFTNFPETHPAMGGTPEGHIIIKNFMSVPAILEDELVGQIGLANSKNGYSDVDLEAIKKVAALYALALQQKRASDELKYRDNILKSTFESSVDGIYVVDINGKVLFSNSKFARLWRIPEKLIQEKSSKKLLDFVSEQLQDPESFLSEVKKLYASTESGVDYLYFKDGRVFERHSTPLMTDLTLKGRVWSFRDITSQREAEKSIINAKLRAEEANRSKTEFLATMSHELRTPLNSVIGFSDILLAQMYGTLNEKQLKYLDNISKSGKHLLYIINDILDISKVESGNESLSFESLEVAAVFEDVKNISFPMAASKNISLTFLVEPRNLYIFVDKVKFKQILHNLVSNALKFTPRAGKVEVSAEKLQNSVKILVRDSGIGIPKDKQELIFEPFKQVDSSLSREYPGTGLGLSLVKKFVKMHGGVINLESEVDKGTTFTFSLPFMNGHEPVFQKDTEIIGD